MDGPLHPGQGRQVPVLRVRAPAPSRATTPTRRTSPSPTSTATTRLSPSVASRCVSTRKTANPDLKIGDVTLAIVKIIDDKATLQDLMVDRK